MDIDEEEQIRIDAANSIVELKERTDGTETDISHLSYRLGELERKFEEHQKLPPGRAHGQDQ